MLVIYSPLGVVILFLPSYIQRLEYSKLWHYHFHFLQI
ncbi:hypothetical protein RINTHM_9980 [Richelia intracellularis HM01]|nr:hypothetical protein RINTHM_9980 [Richelia intracellularis HM01]